MNLSPTGGIRSLDHLVDVGRTEVLAWVTELSHATFVADVNVMDDQVGGLVFFVFGTGIIDVGKLVKRELAVSLGGIDHVCFRSTVWRQLGERFHALVAGVIGVMRAKTASPGDLLDPGVEHSGEEALFKALMEVANRP